MVKHAGEEVTIRVWVDGHQIKVGFDGPRSFEVRREELAKERQHVDTR